MSKSDSSGAAAPHERWYLRDPVLLADLVGNECRVGWDEVDAVDNLSVQTCCRHLPTGVAGEPHVETAWLSNLKVSKKVKPFLLDLLNTTTKTEAQIKNKLS